MLYSPLAKTLGCKNNTPRVVIMLSYISRKRGRVLSNCCFKHPSNTGKFLIFFLVVVVEQNFRYNNESCSVSNLKQFDSVLNYRLQTRSVLNGNGRRVTWRRRGSSCVAVYETCLKDTLDLDSSQLNKKRRTSECWCVFFFLY